MTVLLTFIAIILLLLYGYTCVWYGFRVGHQQGLEDAYVLFDGIRECP